MAFTIPTVSEDEARKKYFRDWARAHPLTDEQKARSKITKAAWRAANPDKVLAAAKRRRNKKGHKEYMLAWRKANKEKVRMYSKKTRIKEKNDPILLERERARQRLVKSKLNPVAKAAYQSEFHKKNPDYRRLWKARAALNPRYIIENRLRTRMHNTLRGRIK